MSVKNVLLRWGENIPLWCIFIFLLEKKWRKKNDIIIARGKHSPEPLVDEADSAATVHFYAR